MLTFAVGLLILGFAVALLGVMLDEVYDWGAKVVVVARLCSACLLLGLAGCVFYYGVHV